MTPWFNIRKAAHVVAFFAREAGGSINVLKLAKLVYLADRQHLADFEYSITNDQFVSMPHGPVNSITLSLISGTDDEREEWSSVVTDRAGHEVGAAREFTDADLDELSLAELQTLAKVWSDFGGMSQYAVRDWTHNHCPEWEDPKGSSEPLPLERILKFLGKENADVITRSLTSERKLRAAFAAK